MWVQSISSMKLVRFQWIYWILFNETSEFTQNSVKTHCNGFCQRKGPKPIRNLWIFWEHFKKLKVWENKGEFWESCVWALFVLFVLFWAAILSTLGQNGTLPASVKCVNLLFWAAILSALGRMALCPHLWSEIRNSGQFWWGEFLRQVSKQQENGLANYGQKTIDFFLI